MLILASAFAYGADVHVVKQSGRTSAATLVINVIVVPTTQSPQLAQTRSKDGAVAYNLEGRRPSSLRVRTSEKTFSPDSHSSAVLETLTILPD